MSMGYMFISEIMKKIKIAIIHQIATMFQSCTKQITHGTPLLLPATPGGRCSPIFQMGNNNLSNLQKVPQFKKL